MSRLQSHLARHVPVEPLDEDELERRKREAWQHQGLAVVRPDELPSDWLARGVEAWANERYGRRIVPQETQGGRQDGR